MPIKLDRNGDITSQLSRLSYSKGVSIKGEVYDYLYSNPNYYFSADELSARIQTAANPVQIEGVLSNHPDIFTYEKRDGTIYWQLDPNASEEELE